VGWRRARVLDASRQVELLQLAQRRALDVGEARHPAQVQERFGVGTLERADRNWHNNNAMRY